MQGTTTIAAASTYYYSILDYSSYVKIYNQGACGGCYSFALSYNLQTNYNMTYNKFIELSPQQGVDCGYKVGCSGCNGGLVHLLMKYMISYSKPLATLASYPYTAKLGTC